MLSKSIFYNFLQIGGFGCQGILLWRGKCFIEMSMKEAADE